MRLTARKVDFILFSVFFVVRLYGKRNTLKRRRIGRVKSESNYARVLLALLDFLGDDLDDGKVLQNGRRERKYSLSKGGNVLQFFSPSSSITILPRAPSGVGRKEEEKG